MNAKLINTRVLVIGAIILFAAVMRLVPHYPNFTPVAAIALFGGAHFSKRWLAFLVPVTALLISDLLLGFHNMMLPVYLSFALVVLLGGFLKKNVRPLPVIGVSLAASTLFFLITNFAVWLGSPFYPPTISGLINCYAMAIPFYHSGLLGDLFYSGVFFGGYYLIEQRYPVLKPV